MQRDIDTNKNKAQSSRPPDQCYSSGEPLTLMVESRKMVFSLYLIDFQIFSLTTSSGICLLSPFCIRGYETVYKFVKIHGFADTAFLTVNR